MTAAYVATTILLAAVVAVALASLYLAWPRRMSAEEWVMRRRAAAAGSRPPAGAIALRPGFRRRLLGFGWSEPVRVAVRQVDSDLRLLQLEGMKGSASDEDFISSLIRLGELGALAGFIAGVLIWIVPGRQGLPLIVVPLAAACAVLAPALEWLRLRRQASSLRSLIRRRLPRLLTGARMLLESGAVTPARALSMAVSVYSDPAADVLREAVRAKEVRRLQLEEELDRVGREFGIEPLHRLADGFRVGGRYGTQMADLLSEFSLGLRQGWHAEYRERINRAPVLMTLPALLFFVLPLLALILLLVFSPLMNTLSQLG